jgi:hypothetical protein
MSCPAPLFTGRCYGVVRVTHELETARSSRYYQQEIAAQPERRLETTWSDAGLHKKIREVIADPPFHSEGPGKVWALLRFAALKSLRQGVRDCCGGVRTGAIAGIRNRCDHGSQFVSDYQAEVAFLSMESLPFSVHQQESNGCVERLIRTLKERSLWVVVFRNIEQVRSAPGEFSESYYQCGIVHYLSYLMPAQARQQLPALGAAA